MGERVWMDEDRIKGVQLYPVYARVRPRSYKLLVPGDSLGNGWGGNGITRNGERLRSLGIEMGIRFCFIPSVHGFLYCF